MAINLQTTMPAVLTPNSQVIVADLDGDGTNELIILDGDIRQLSVVSQYTYSQFTPNSVSSAWPSTQPYWPTDVSFRWITLWAAQQGAVPGGWGIESGDTILAADLDGDGSDELFIYNLYYSRWGVLKWLGGQLQTLCQAQVTAPSGYMTWSASLNDQYFIVPNLNGIDSTLNGAGIFAFNSSTKALGIMAYSNGGFIQPWRHDNPQKNGWVLRSNDQFYAGNFASKTSPSVVVYNADGYIAILEWNIPDFSGWHCSIHTQGQSAGQWNFRSSDQFQCADLDGDGITEILVYNLNDPGYLGVLQWDEKALQFQSLVVVPTQVANGSAVWNLGGSQQYYCFENAGEAGQIYAFSPSSSQAALLTWQSNHFVCQWSGQSFPNDEWRVTRGDIYCAGTPFSGSTPRLFVISQQGTAGAPVLTLGALSWDGAAPIPSIASSTALPIPAWSPSFLAGAPGTQFTSFPPGDLSDMYIYISNLFPASPPTDDVRSCYTNSNYQGQFSDFVNDIPETSPKPEWDPVDWGYVSGMIRAECLSIITVYGMYNGISGIGALALDLYAMQKNNLQMVKTSIQNCTESAPDSPVAYWIGQFVVAALWGLGAAVTAPEGEVVNLGAIICSMGASLLGSALSYDPTQQQSIILSEITTEIDGTFNNSCFTNSNDLGSLLGDPVKLAICNQLAGNEWKISASSWGTNGPAYAIIDRLCMYKELLPSVFMIWFGPGISSPSHDFTVNTLYSANGDIYGLRWATQLISPTQFQEGQQAPSLGPDLFSNLGASESDFFGAVGFWRTMPRTNFTG